ncbi:hypothetical protein BLAHAN_05820 [Blautia hansenii DSM 20583]|uniref:Uncharacterized protein n=1 Tax=Blautia hansenii DSM 20583 TaxID=537007 RepID=C9L8U8_BLAHA|nr:hypothetical protein BLAHAN_05820 [Blautia hansenii DSM 20583]
MTDFQKVVIINHNKRKKISFYILEKKKKIHEKETHLFLQSRHIFL